MRQSIATGTTTARELGLGTIPVWSWLPAAEIESGALEQITTWPSSRRRYTWR